MCGCQKIRSAYGQAPIRARIGSTWYITAQQLAKGLYALGQFIFCNLQNPVHVLCMLVYITWWAK